MSIKVTLQEDQWIQIMNALYDSVYAENMELLKEIKYQIHKSNSITEFRQNLKRNGYKI